MCVCSLWNWSHRLEPDMEAVMLYSYNEAVIFHHFVISDVSMSTTYSCVFFLTSTLLETAFIAASRFCTLQFLLHFGSRESLWVCRTLCTYHWSSGCRQTTDKNYWPFLEGAWMPGYFYKSSNSCSISVTATNISLLFSGGVVHVYNRKVVFLYGMIFFNNTATRAAT